MLKKDKNCIEFSMHSMMTTHKTYWNHTDITITGIIPDREIFAANNPFDIPCDVVVVSKKDFDRLQADDQHYREMAKQWEDNYNLLLEKTGFTSVVDLIDYICDPSMTSPEDKTLKEIIDECEKDYIFERDKAEALQTENEQLKKKLEEFSPVPECLVSVNGWEESAKFWKKRYDDIFKLVGFSSEQEVEDYLVNETNCETLYEAMLKFIKENKYACEMWCNANSRNNSWKAAAECNTPKELMEKIEGFETEIIDLKTKKTEYACKIQDLIDDSCGRKTVIESYKRDIEKWKEATGCPSPSAAKTLIESAMSYVHAYHEAQEENRKLTDEVKSWQKATGCDTPGVAEERIKYYKNRLGNAVQAASCASKHLDNITF